MDDEPRQAWYAVELSIVFALVDKASATSSGALWLNSEAIIVLPLV